MSSIIVVETKKQLIKYLSKHNPDRSTVLKYLLFDQFMDGADSILHDSVFNKCDAVDYDENYVKKFSKEYTSLIGDIGDKNDPLLWWATDMSSKNRFFSLVPQILQQFLDVVRVIESHDDINLLVVNPQYAAIHSLKKFAYKKGVSFLDKRNIFKELALLCWQISRKTGGVFYNALRTAYRGMYSRVMLGNLVNSSLDKDTEYYVLKSFLYNHSLGEDGKYDEVFFGRLPKFLKSQGKKVLVLADILGDYRFCVNRIKNGQDTLIVLAEHFMSFSNIVKASAKVLFGKIHIGDKCSFFGYDVSDIVKYELLRSQKGISLYQFLHYWCISDILEKIKIHAFVITYENVPWEKICTIALREKSPDTKIVGYQHTVVPQASLNLFTNSRAKNFPMPDKIIASGNIPKQIMEKYGEYEEGFIETACALRYEHISGFERRPRQQTGRLLVALEGVLKANQMIQYVLDQLAGDENFQVTIRTHPVLPWKHYSRRFGHRISAVSNFEISADKDLKSDIEASDAVIYWGSTVSLESLSMGVPVIHYSTGSMLSYDPLFECPYLKWNVSERVQLRDVMNDIYTFDINDFTTFQQKAGDYISNHFHPVSDEKLHKFIL